MKNINNFINESKSKWTFVGDFLKDPDDINFDDSKEFLEFYPLDNVIQMMSLEDFKDEDIRYEMIDNYDEKYYNDFIKKVSALKYGESFVDDDAPVIVLRIKK